MNELLDEIKKSKDQVVIDRNVRITTAIREELESNDFYALNSKTFKWWRQICFRFSWKPR